MTKNYKRLAVSEKTYNKIMKDCLNLFLEKNPDFSCMKITHDFIVDRIARVYLKEL